MANSEHLKILKQGAEVWNEWREENSEIRPDLVQADLSGANLSGAVLANATSGYTSFGDNDLGQVKGLETVIHFGPSKIDVGTIYKSQGKIPEVFLRGCGVPESFIVQMRALVASTEAIQFYSCFISYSSKDQDFATDSTQTFRAGACAAGSPPKI